MNAEWLLNWWNLIFLLPFALALLYLGLYTVSGITFGEGGLDADGSFDADGGFDADADADLSADADVDHDFDADHDLDTNHDLDADHDLDSDHDADGDHDAEHEADEGGGWMAPLAWLGVGRVPLSIVLMVLLLSWGAAGFLTNSLLVSRGAAAAVISIPIAAALSLLITRWVTVLIARFLPLYETTARRRHALLGSIGSAIFPINQKFGMASVRDETGDLYQVPCRVEPSAQPIAKGSSVKLVAYNAKDGLFYVTACASEAQQPVA